MGYDHVVACTRPASFARSLASFAHAWRGVVTLFRQEPNVRIHALATALVVALGAHFGLTRTEWCLVVIAVTLVFVAEAVNTALERVCDRVSPEFHPLVRVAKDVAAAAVLFAAVGAAVVGVLVFGGHIAALVKNLAP
jgi:diacylglycerol kinase